MKKEKDIVKFFNHYSERMLPTDEEQFIEILKQNIDRLPIPSAFNEKDPEKSMEYTKWLLEKIKKDYERSRRDAIISSIFTSIIIAVVFLGISALGLLDINNYVTLGILALMVLVSIGFMFSMLPLRIKDLF